MEKLVFYFFESYLRKYVDYDEEKLKENCFDDISNLLKLNKIEYNENELIYIIHKIYYDLVSFDEYDDIMDTSNKHLNRNSKEIIRLLDDLKINNEFNKFKSILDFDNFDTKYVDEIKQVEVLKKVPQPEQRTEMWYKMRMNMITASEAYMALRHNIKQYILKKCGLGNKFTGNTATRWGQQYEDVAIMIYEKYTKKKVTEFGLIQHPKLSIFGASPDGITDDGRMLEIKCPYSRKLTGEPLHHYWIQTQIQLEVCNLSKCDFFECVIKEFNNFESWRNNQDNNCKEKGVMVGYHSLNDIDNRHFEYCPLNFNHKDMLKWINEKKINFELNKNTKFKNFIFKEHWWILKETSLNTIHRDKEWFKANYPKFKQTWEKVLYHMKNGCNELLSKTITINFNNINPNENCMMDDSDSDSD